MYETEGLTIAQAVEKAKARRAESAEPTANDEPVAQDVLSTDDDTQDAPQLDLNTDESVEDESEESETQEVAEEETSEDESDLFYELDDEEVSASQLREWKAGAMKAADYTRKTQELASQRKEFEAKQAEFSEKQQALEAKLAEVEAIIADETLDDEAVKELREYEPEKYIEYTERQAKRKELVKNSKTAKPENNFQQEYANFAKANEGWFENDKPTEKAKKDIATMTAYAEKQGLTNDDLQGLKAGHFKMLLDAAKYDSTKQANAAVTKKVRKAPVTTRPRQGVQTSLEQQIKAADDKFKRSGSIADGVALRKLKQQLNK